MNLADSMVVAAIPVTDLDRALPFYRDVLRLRLLDQSPFALRFGAGTTQITVYRRPPIEREHTTCHFEVADIDATVADLKSRGVVFEEYDAGPIATTNSIANYAPGIRGAWFKDPDGNIIGLREGPQFGGWSK
jgi:catechol 2,3-dioxygenase-like lactoylglutathione lyase family enzyme